jgi:TPR repeat protein
LYNAGRGGEMDYAQARKWYEKAADAGEPHGMLYLGVLYEKGQGVAADPVEARRWYEKALAAGVSEASTFIKGSSSPATPVSQPVTEAKPMPEKSPPKRKAHK